MKEPAFPLEFKYDGTYSEQQFKYDGTYSEQHYGLTKLEYACIKLKIPKSGNEELDALIRESQLNDFASQAMEGLLSATNEGEWDKIDLITGATRHAKELIKQLGEVEQ